jgi:hypothetical protein
MRGTLVAAVAAAALIATAVANAAPSCPGPGCGPAGNFTIPVPKTGKAAFYVVTITGKAPKVSAVGAAVMGRSVTGNVEMAGFAPKPKVKGGKVTIKLYFAIANPKSRLKLSARASTAGIGLEAFVSPLLPNPSPPVVKQESPAKFDRDYHALFGLGLAWLQDWESHSPPPGTKASDVILQLIGFGS